MQLPDVLENLLYEELADCISEGLLSAINSDDITWITVKGNHIPILEGQSKSQAIKSFFKNKQKEPPTDGIVEDVGKAVKDLIEYATCETKEPAYQYPKTIANVSKGKPMTFYEADSNRSNPRYTRTNPEYYKNCQSCVVAFEARRRGYNVQAAKRNFNKHSKSTQLAKNASWAWLDPKTDKKCEFTNYQFNKPADFKKWLESNIKTNERYQYAYSWFDKKTGEKHGHTVIIDRNYNNGLRLYDAQTGHVYQDKIFDWYLQHYPAYKKDEQLLNHRILRIDDKKFNPYFMNDVMIKADN